MTVCACEFVCMCLLSANVRALGCVCVCVSVRVPDGSYLIANDLSRHTTHMLPSASPVRAAGLPAGDGRRR